MNLKRGKKILDEWKEVHRIRRINQRLYDYLASSIIIYLIEYFKKHDFILPHKDRQIKMIDESEKIMDEISPPNFKHPMEHLEIQQNKFYTQ